MKRTYLVLVSVLALCALVSRQAVEPAVDTRKLLLGRWHAVDLPPMCFSWDYQFRGDGTGTQYYENGGVMGQFCYSFDGRALKIFREEDKSEGPTPVRFVDADNFELAGPQFTIRFHRREAGF